MKAAVVGSGLVGSLWALLLRQRGYEVTLYEKRSDPRKAGTETGRSINLVITSRGLYALERAGLVKQALEITIPVYGRIVHPVQGETKFQTYGREKECNYSVSRAGLNNFLLTAAEKSGVDVHFNHKLEKIDFETKTMNFGGRNVSYDLLFGADGAGSAVRAQMAEYFKDPSLEKTEWLEADYKELVMPAGPGGRPLLEKNALHIWPRGSHMLMALANGDGSFTLTLYLTKVGPKSFSEMRTRRDVQNLFETEFPDAVPLLPRYQEEFEKNPQGALGTVRCRRWTVGASAALMGDAAHAIIPFFGQGMNCGFEDATELLKLVDEHHDDWPRVLPAYETSRKPDTDAIADLALENWGEMKEKVADQGFLLRKKIEGWLEEQFPDLYKSRYGMVTYTLIPYRLAQKAGFVQDKILAELCRGIASVNDLSRPRAEELLRREFLPFLRANKIDLARYEPKYI